MSIKVEKCEFGLKTILFFGPNGLNLLNFFFFFIRTAMEIQKCLDVPFEKLTALVKSLTEKFHDRHYLLILVKKHITFMYGDDLGSLSKEQLKDRLKLCEEVSKY